jgi:dihydrofolate reductase
MKTKLIVAICEGRGIGKNGALPWHSKEDLAFFSRMTKGNAVIMGRSTWEGLPTKPLPKRTNIVLSRQPSISCPGAYHCTSIEEAYALCTQIGTVEAWVIGGAQVYAEYLDKNKIDECYISQINGSYKCDTFFPLLKDDWKKIKVNESTTETADGSLRCIERWERV